MDDKPRKPKNKLRTGAFFVLAICCYIHGSSYAAVSEPVGASHLTIPPTLSRHIRALVAGALVSVANLRAEAHNGKSEDVSSELKKLNTLVMLVKTARPTGEIDALADFYRQHLGFEDNKQVLADILPLYKALDVLPKSKQTDAARQQLDAVRTALQSGQKADALTALGNMRRILSNDGIDFPLQAAEEMLRSITMLYYDNHTPPKESALLELENHFLQILSSLS